MRFALSRTHRVEWPFTYARTIAQVEAGAITTLAGLRAFMQQEALSEPGKQKSVSSSSSSAPQHSSSGKGSGSSSGKPAWRNNGGRKIAAAIQHETEDGDARSEGEMEETRVNATSRGQARGATCYNCKGSHDISECTKPRMCWGCRSTGHVRADCPTAPFGRPPAKAAGSAPSKKPTQSKNE